MWSAGQGLGTSFQAEPFQCSMSVRDPPSPSQAAPTAQALLPDVAAIPERKPGNLRLGLGATVQAEPFQRAIAGCSAVQLPRGAHRPRVGCRRGGDERPVGGGGHPSRC